MKKRLVSVLMCVVIALGASVMPVNADDTRNGMIAGYSTAYCLHGITASGEPVRDGICASSRDRLGCAIILYQRLPDGGVGEPIGKYECKDTGGTKGIKSGKVIDVWVPDMDAVQEHMDLLYSNGCEGKVWIRIIEPEE